MRALYIIILIASVAILVWLGVSYHKEIEKEGAIVNQVRPLIGECINMGQSPITIHGKCLVWNVIPSYRVKSMRVDQFELTKKDSRSGAQGYLSRDKEFVASSPDSQITVFMIIATRTVLVGRYTDYSPAYGRYSYVCVAYWPDIRSVGMYSIYSSPPHAKRGGGPGYSDPDSWIADWIGNLPRDSS